MGDIPPNGFVPGLFQSAPPDSTYVPAALNPDGSITPGYFLLSDKDCPTCKTNPKPKTKADSRDTTTVNYEQYSAGPVNLTHYSASDGSLSMWAPGVAPTSTDVGATAGTCLVSPGAGQSTADVVDGWSVGGAASTGVGVETSVSGNSSGLMACAGVSAGTPGISPTYSYAMTPSGWVDALTPTPEQADAMYRSIP